MATVMFEQVAEEITATAEILGDEVTDVLNEYAPSIIAKYTEDIVLIVPSEHPLWSDELKSVIATEITGHRDEDGSPRQIEFVLI